jgi:hypothetical protein
MASPSHTLGSPWIPHELRPWWPTHLHEDGGAERRAVKAQFAEGRVELNLLLRQRLHFLAETFERRLQLVPQITFRLLGCKVVPGKKGFIVEGF